jgi:hypothetical protein
MGRLSHRCKCQDGRLTGRWVVLTPPAAPGKFARLKCLACGWKFSKRAKYVETLPRHMEESRSGMSDHDVLDRINSGTLLVDTDLAIVTSCTARHGTKTLRVIERESNRSTYRFVEITAGGKKKKVALHRLVWMAAHRQIPPAGYDVHHVNGKQVANPDAIWNLDLLSIGENRSTNRRYVDPAQREFAF